VSSGSGGLDGPPDLTFGPNGNLFVTSGGNSEVLEYDGNTGTLVTTFVGAGSGGLNGPNGLTFGPNGNLFVSSTANNEVLEYDGSTGAFVTTFVTSGSGGLDGSSFLLFSPEPGTWLLVACGLAVLIAAGRVPITNALAATELVLNPRTPSDSKKAAS
jgi:WD40 repeat protein